MYAHGPGKIPVSPDTSHPRFPGIFDTFNRKIFLNRVRRLTVGKGSGYARLSKGVSHSVKSLKKVSIREE